MREILFRGKRIRGGDWVKGCYLAVNEKAIYIQPKREVCPYEVDPSTVGQYTGLNDKNYNQIFEGDIIQYYESQLDGKETPVCDVVAYTDGGFAVKSYFLNNWLLDSVHGNIQLQGVEVIGNIHDNPELLKGGES